MKSRRSPSPFRPLMPNAAILSGQRRAVAAAKRLERRNHVLSARKPRAAAVGAEFALAREPHDDHRREEGQHQLGNDGRDPERWTMSTFVAENDLVDDAADQARGDEHEGVDDALNQRERHHVAVRDVGHLVAEDGLDLAAVHALQ